MKVFDNFPHEGPESPEFEVVTLGVFDGVHRGHQAILETAFRVAAGRPVALVTFDPHPRAVLGPPKRHRLLSPIPERLQLLERWPLAGVAILRFDQEVARQSYVDFVREALVRGLGARHLVLGYDVTLGHHREGNGERLGALGQELGYQLTLVPAVGVDGETVSSTLVRHRLDEGRVDEAARLLGRPYDLIGTVVRGEGRGRKLGHPTANLALPDDKLVPANGVYAVAAVVSGNRHLGALNIGILPTFQDQGTRTIEVHLLDFEADLYGTPLRLELLQRLRPERRFETPQALKTQITKDLQAVRRLAKDV